MYQLFIEESIKDITVPDFACLSRQCQARIRVVNERRNELKVSGIAKPYQATRRYSLGVPWRRHMTTAEVVSRSLVRCMSSCYHRQMRRARQ